jgi:exopolysaccharide biosynthesis WecB/TagA/CpsF family protein
MNSTVDRNAAVQAPRWGTNATSSVAAGNGVMLGSFTTGIVMLLDMLAIGIAAQLATLLNSHGPMPFALGNWGDQALAVWGAALLAPFILHDRRFAAPLSPTPPWVLWIRHLLRVALLAALFVAMTAASGNLADFLGLWLATWLIASLLATSLARAAIGGAIAQLRRRGALSEVIAVVGAGAVADQLVVELRRTRHRDVELLGTFDDQPAETALDGTALAGTVAQLIELGKTRKIDWIVLTMPPTATQELAAMVQRLKALAVPIALCPQHIGNLAAPQSFHLVAGGVAVAVLAARPMRRRWDALRNAAQGLVPRWIVTLGLMPLEAIEAGVNRVAALRRSRVAPTTTFQFDRYDLEAFTGVASRFGQDSYAFVVTPNTDHLIRLHEDPAFRDHYAQANFILLDSRFLAHILRFTKGITLPVCTGSDLTAKLFADVISQDDTLVLIGGSAAQAQQLTLRYGLRKLAHFNPPMGFIRDPDAVEECLRFVEAHSPFRFCLLAVGAPQQEAIAQQLKVRGKARGMALCIGASINFLTGEERRAPLWMQRGGVEWLYRLLQAPSRMARRYLVRGPRVFALLRHARIVLRQRPAAVLHLVPPSVVEAPPPAVPVVAAARLTQIVREG